MLYKKTGFPEEHEIVICTVTAVQYHSVFAKLDEYGLSGMVHISEIAAGRIRNIRDYVKEGKVIVCKVLRVNKEKGHVDLSLRRASETQRREKINQMKHEQKAEAILDNFAKDHNLDFKKLYKDISGKVFKQYSFLFECFEDVVEKSFKLVSLGIESDTAADLEVLIRQRIKPKEVEIKGVLSLESYDGNGVEHVKQALTEADKVKGTEIRYLGGGKYQVSVKAKDYKIAEPALKESVDIAISLIEKSGGKGTFDREGKKV